MLEKEKKETSRKVPLSVDLLGSDPFCLYFISETVSFNEYFYR